MVENNSKVDAFIEKLNQWQDEFKILRIQDFKHYCALLFEKGAIMEDPYQTLIQQTKNVQAARQLRFESLEEISKREEEIKWYLAEAIRIEKSGKKVPMKSTEEYEMPEELSNKFEAMPALKEAFYKLTPGRQRQYMYHIGQAKRAATREQRVEKYVDHILNGKGLNDK